MATYIPQVQDKMEKVNPPQTNWQFQAQGLQTAQSKYDQGHTQLSKLYGNLLNKGLTREGNIQAREEFFKTIDQDLRKIAGLDLSKSTNVTQAQQVFNQIYDNDVLVKDMVWTDQYRKEMQRAESFRGCTDPSKCGGEFWEDGIKAMNYQREEYKNMADQESLSAQPVRYVPYNNMMEKALEYAKEAELSVTRDELSGRYIYRTKNGSNLVSPLTDMFQQLFENNPQLHDMYKVQAYNARKDWTYRAFQSGQFESLDQAGAAYVEMRGNEIIEASKVVSRGVDMDVSSIESRLKALQKDFDNGVFTQKDSKKIQEVQNLQSMLVGAKTAQQYTDLIKSAQKNMHNQTNMNAIGNVLDDAMAIGIFNQDLNVTARTLAHKDMEVTMTADKFALEDQAYSHKVALENLSQRNKMALETHKAQLKGNETDPNAVVYMMDYDQKQALVNDFKIGDYLINNLDSDTYSGMGANVGDMTESDIRNYLATSNDANNPSIRAKLNDALQYIKTKKQDANEAAIKAHKHGNPIGDVEFHWDQFTPQTWKSFDANIPEETREGLEIPEGVLSLAEENGGRLYHSYGTKGTTSGDFIFLDQYYKDENNKWYQYTPSKEGIYPDKPIEVKSRSRIDLLESGAKVTKSMVIDNKKK